MKTAIKHLIILFVALFIFNLNIKADKETIPIEGEFQTTGVRSTIDIPAVEVSLDQDLSLLYLDFYRSIASVTVLVIDEGNNIVFYERYDNLQAEIFPLDSLSKGKYRIELQANGGVMSGWFSIN